MRNYESHMISTDPRPQYCPVIPHQIQSSKNMKRGETERERQVIGRGGLERAHRCRYEIFSAELWGLLPTEHHSQWVCECGRLSCAKTQRSQGLRGKGPLHLIRGSLKHFFLSPYVVIRVQAPRLCPIFLLTWAFLHPRTTAAHPSPPSSSPLYLVSFLFIRGVGRQLLIITYSVFLSPFSSSQS